jgi:hypothetical protein
LRTEASLMGSLQTTVIGLCGILLVFCKRRLQFMREDDMLEAQKHIDGIRGLISLYGG